MPLQKYNIIDFEQYKKEKTGADSKGAETDDRMTNEKAELY